MTIEDGSLSRSVAKEIRGIMGREEISQTTLAKKLDRSQAYISDRINYKAAFDLDDIEGLADLISEDPFDLLERITSRAREESERPQRPGLSRREREQLAKRKTTSEAAPTRKRSQSG